MKSVIQVRNLNLYYGTQHALKQIEMDIDAKEITAFIGPSGCGKSSLLRTFNRMNDLIPNVTIQGTVKIDHTDIYHPKTVVPELRKRVGMVFQKPTAFPKSIFDNVAYGLRVNGWSNKDEIYHKVVDALKKAALWSEVKDKLFDSALQLSGGQQQRLCIARSIAIDPEILLMDEPTSALDPISTAKIEDLVKELSHSLTIVIVTHNMQQAARISKKTAFFLMGDLIEFGDTKKIFEKPQKEETKRYTSGQFG